MKALLTTIIVSCSFFVQAQLTYAYGSYTGTGSAQSITGVGFQPEAVMIKSEGAHEAYIATSDMPAGEAKAMGTGSVALETGKITSLNADGFSVGTDSETNNSSTTYHFVAYDEAGDLVVGTYTGNGTGSAQTISGVGFAAESIWIMGDGTSSNEDAVIYLNTYGAESSEGFFTRNGSSSAAADFVNAVGADGFDTGDAGGSPDRSGVNYYYLAFNESGNTFAQNTYDPGADSDGQTITISGTSSFQPDFMLVNEYLSEPVFRIASLTGDKTLSFDAQAAETGLIKSFESTGITIGTDDRVSTAWNNHHYFGSSGGSTLPVELTTFNGFLQDDGTVLLKWATASETNSSHFVVQKSTDAENFEDVTNIQSAGFSEQMINYEWTDVTPSSGKNYYRLKQVDLNQDFEIFKTIIIDVSGGQVVTNVNVFPNPIQDRANIYFEAPNGGTFQFKVHDLSGNTVYSAQILAAEGSNNIEFDAMLLEKGLYIANLTNPNGETSQMKFYKK